MGKELGKSGKRHEEKHARDTELEFKIFARRNRMLGHWAAEKLGLTGDAAQAYAKEVVIADFDEPGEEDVVRKVMGDFRKNGVATSESELRAEMARLLDAAREHLEKQA
jgi:hypothetical protein